MHYDECATVRGKKWISTIPVLVDTNNRSLTPENTYVPESAVPMPTAPPPDVPATRTHTVVGIISAFAGMLSGKKGD